jgi:pimeloyl-ACP methyl ester carboxylesterase
MTRVTSEDRPSRRQCGGKYVDVQRFEHQAAGVDWHCEQRGDGPPVVLVPSGEGDCTSFEQVAAQLADEFAVLTFDTPGFSRSRVQTTDDISVLKLAEQIAGPLNSRVSGRRSIGAGAALHKPA